MTKLEEAAKACRDAAKAHRDAEARKKAAHEEYEAADRALDRAVEEHAARLTELQDTVEQEPTT